MSFWICVFDKNCKCCFDSCNKLRRHQRINHAAESYRYAHCALSQDKKSYSVRILDQGQCITAFQLKKREKQDEIVKEVYRRFVPPSICHHHPVNQFYFEKLEHIKSLIEDLQRMM
jgi:hypothetical protein